MKKSGFLAASVAAASASASAVSVSNNPNFNCNTNFQISRQVDEQSRDQENSNTQKPGSTTDKFAPRFDGLRFIETLITAHK